MKYGAVPCFSRTIFLLLSLLAVTTVDAQESSPPPVPPQSTAPASQTPATATPANTATPSTDSAPPAPAESPADLYDRAMQPVEIVRRSPNNITDAEIAAWGVAVVTAAHACSAHMFDRYSGEDLFHFARLCQLGQQYEDAYAEASKYIRDGNTKSLESARALIVRSALSSGNMLRAQQGSYDLLRNHPYDGTVHTMVQETILALAATDAMENAINLVETRKESLMAALRDGTGLALHEGTYRVPQSTLVRDALEAVYMYRAENRIMGAQEKATELVDSVRQIVGDTSSKVSAVERDAMQAAVRRAEMLMTPAPPVPVEASSSKAVLPRTVIPYEKKITVLAFYAPWSPQRKAMFDLLASIANDYRMFPLQIYAVTTAAVATGDSGAEVAKLLPELTNPFEKVGPPVPIVVSTDAVTHGFATDDWPMFAVVDPGGKVRFLDTLTSPEYKDGGRMHRLVAALASIEGPLPHPPAAVKTKSGRVKVPEGTLQRVPK